MKKILGNVRSQHEVKNLIMRFYGMLLLITSSVTTIVVAIVSCYSSS